MKKKLEKGLILLIWLGLWQLMALRIPSRILFAGPLQVLKAFGHLLTLGDFYRTVWFTLFRIFGGFALAFALGILAAAAACKSSWTEAFLEPMVLLFQSVPIASFVVLALIWFGSKKLSILITLIVVFPIIYRNVLDGIRQADPELLEVAKVYCFGPVKRIRLIYLPGIRTRLLTAVRVAAGMAWKAGVAAELIGVPAHSIGERVYLAKVYLDTADLFAWTLVIVLAAAGSERLLVLGLAAVLDRMEKMPCRPWIQAEPPGPSGAVFNGIGKAFGEKRVLKDITLNIEAGGIYGICGPSGSGKTTFLRLLLGLEQADEGGLQIEPGRQAVVFQENRLFEEATALENIYRCMGREGFLADPARLLSALIGEENLTCRAGELSGGMKRRTALVRALVTPSGMLVLDEPFTGSDPEKREEMLEMIRTCRFGRTVLIVSHERDCLERMGAVLLEIKEGSPGIRTDKACEGKEL